MPPARGRPRGRGAALLALAAVAVLVAGCDYLTSLALGPGAYPTLPPDFSFDPDDPAFSFDPNESEPPPLATFTKGMATVTIDGEVTSLSHVVGKTGMVAEDVGGQASWTNGKGWYVQVFGATVARGGFDGGVFVSIDRIQGGQHWTISDPSKCDVTVTKADETGMSGTATCKGARWADLMGGYDDRTGPALVEGEPAFDAAITFEATP